MAFRNCIICKNNDSSENYCEMDGQQYVICNSCGLIYVEGYASQEDMNKAYTGGGLKSLRRKLMAPLRKMRHLKNAKEFTLRANEIFEYIKDKYDTPLKDKNYMDIGCNKGFLLEQAINNGLDVYGVELVKEVMAPFKNSYPEYKEKVYHERFSNVASKFDDGYFDIISAIDVVEHFEDPVSDMKHIYRILKNDGIFVIQTPDADAKESKELKCSWGGLKPLEHLHLFSRSNFIKFAKDVGFSEVITGEPIEYCDGNFMAVMKK